MKSHYHFKDIPWKDIAIGTFVLDDKGGGMSKSKGNVVWADEIFKKYDIDTFRYWVGAASFGSDISFSENEMLAGKRFLTKLWNASKFSLMFLEKYKEKKVELEPFDKYFLIKLDKVVKEATKHFENYDFGQAKRTMDNFFWNSFCDNYLEIVKKRLYNDLGNKTESAKYTLHKILISILKLYAPIVPHIADEIYSNFSKESIHISSWPKSEDLKDTKFENLGDMALEVIYNVRKFKADNNKSLKEEINLTLNVKKLEIFKEDLEAVCNAKISFGKEFGIEIKN